MELTPEQAERVAYLLEGEWCGQAASDKLPEYWVEFDRALARVESAAELHAFADRWNWDGGMEPVRRALAHPLCDRGTALLVYWRLSPIYYLHPTRNTRAKLEATSAPDALENWDLLRAIERRLESSDFRSARMPFDPTNDHGRDRTRQRRKHRPIPILEVRDGKVVKVGEEVPPDDPEIDVRAALPSVVFEPVV